MTVLNLPSPVDAIGRGAAESLEAWAGRSRGELARLALEVRRAGTEASRSEQAVDAAGDGPPVDALAAVDETMGQAWRDGQARLDQVRREATLVLDATWQQAQLGFEAGRAPAGSAPASAAARLPEITPPRPPRRAIELWEGTSSTDPVGPSVREGGPLDIGPVVPAHQHRSADDETFWKDLPDEDSVFARLRRLERRSR